MPNIIPIRDLRDTSKISEMCNSSDEPIFITKNGYGDMVIMSMELYEERMSRIDIYNKVMEAVDSKNNGDIVDGDTVKNLFKNKYDK